MTDWTDHHQSISEWISDHSHTELQTATTGVQETITCSSSGWWLLFSPSTSCEKTCSPTATDAQHSSDSEQQHSEQQHSSSSTAAEGECLPTYCFSSTQGNWTHFKGCVCACVYSWLFSVPALHGDYCVMWITCHCWVFSVPHRASGVRFKHKHTGSSDTLRSHQSAM